MSKEPRVISTGALEDYMFSSSLRIPPLLNPLPRLPSRRPSPLEPNARVNDGAHNATARLSSRSKALDEAKLIGDEDITTAYPTRSRGAAPIVAKPHESPEVSRKRQKVDYYQLPKPTDKTKTSKPPPFKPVPILNELHEPPPSAGLFPPITPNVGHEARSISSQAAKPPTITKPQTNLKSSPQKPSDGPAPAKDAKGRTKRVCLRGRNKWTDNETQDLLKGVGMYGVGKWKKILNHPDLSFHPDRTMVDLKDRYRTCRMNEEKSIERQASTNGAERAQKSTSRTRSRGRDSQVDAPPQTDDKTSQSPTEPQSASPEVKASFNVFTPKNFDKQALTGSKSKKPGASQPWTAEEDADLSKGYQKYGFQWTAIAKDKDLHLSHRTGAQVRDRFRMKYPVVYQSSVPLPLPEVTKRPSRARSLRRSSTAPQANDISSTKKPSSQLTFIINDPVASARHLPNATPTTSIPTRTTQPGSMAQAELIGNKTKIVDRFHGLDVQPLPDPDSGSDYSDMSSAEERSRQSTAEAEEARHLSILGLLNEDVDQSSRLPPFKYPYDEPEWSTGESITLPPLHWEEIGNRPIFDLE